MSRVKLTSLAAVCLAFLVGCSSQQRDDGAEASRSALTPGGVKLMLEKGKTTQSQVLEAFGTPDLVTIKDGQEVWTYDKTSYDYERRSDYATAIFVGTSGDKVRSSSRSTLLIVYFNPQDVVTDYRLSAVKY